MKARKMIAYAALSCLFISVCIGMGVTAQETELFAAESSVSQVEETEETEQTEASKENETQSEETETNGTETNGTETEKTDSKDQTQSESGASGKESETKETTDQTEEKLSLKFEIPDQRIASGKSFREIKVPEYAIAEDGSKVTGTVLWMAVKGTAAYDPNMELCGCDGDKLVFQWRFLPDTKKYAEVNGTVTLTLYMESTAGGTDIWAGLSDMMVNSKGNGQKGSISSSGSSFGASNIKEVSSPEEASKWMDSSMTGVGAIGNFRGDDVREAGNETITIVHGTVVRDETEKTEETEVTEAESETEATDRTEKTEAIKNTYMSESEMPQSEKAKPGEMLPVSETEGEKKDAGRVKETDSFEKRNWSFSEICRQWWYLFLLYFFCFRK